MRFHFHISFITVLLGAFLFTPDISLLLLPKLFVCYLIFNVLIYGGLYTFNDIIDVKADAAHTIKKMRPIPTGKVSIRSAAYFCFFLISIGLFLGYFYLSIEVYRLLFIFILLNFGYTLMFKKMIYLNLAIVASTHTLRLVLGMSIAETNINIALVAAFYCLLFGVAVTIHSMFNLKNYEIPYYTKKIVILVQAICLLSALLLLMISGQKLNLPISIFCVLFFILSLCSRFEYFRPVIAKIFMVKLKPVSTPKSAT